MRTVTNLLGEMTRSVIIVLALAFVATAAAQQRSDFEIVKSFQSKYNAIRAAIRDAKTVQDCAEISANIAELQNEFVADTVLLNKSLYPDKYDDMIENATVELHLTQDKLGLIETQVARIADLETQVRQLSGKVDSLTNENSKLMASLDVLSKAVTKNTRTIDSLNHLVALLRRDLRARDAAIFSMVDSMFTQYGKDVSGLPEQQKGMLLRKVQSHNVVANILQAARQNTQFLESTQLTGNDLAAMVKEEKQFSANWKKVGPKLADVYISARERGKQMEAIDTAIAIWGRKADSAMWAGLNAEFAAQKIPVRPFNNAGEFVANLGDYFDTQGGDANASSSDKAGKLKHFLDAVWNPSVGSDWVPMLVDQGVITKDQETQLQTKLTSWEDAAKPSYTLWYILIIVAILVMIALVVRGRRKNAPPAPSQN